MKTRIMAVALAVLLFLSPSRVSAFEHCPADLNGDGEVGAADLAMLLASWGPCDVCGDGVVEGPEECDPPDGVLCDENCVFLPPPDCCFPHPSAGCENQICESAVCAVDPFCCNDWSVSCAWTAAIVCPECFGYDCCFDHARVAPPGCTDIGCTDLVCEILPECCVSGWDGDCADEAVRFCPQGP